jgi:hypothetical protein
VSIRQQNQINALEAKVTALEKKIEMLCDYIAADAPDVIQEPKKIGRPRKVNGAQAQ